MILLVSNYFCDLAKESILVFSNNKLEDVKGLRNHTPSPEVKGKKVLF